MTRVHNHVFNSSQIKFLYLSVELSLILLASLGCTKKVDFILQLELDWTFGARSSIKVVDLVLMVFTSIYFIANQIYSRNDFFLLNSSLLDIFLRNRSSLIRLTRNTT